MTLLDQFQRPLRDLRISVTDRCNFRCTYCMPDDEYPWIRRDQILSFEEIARAAAVFVSLGVSRIRLTGGEPLVRKDLPTLVAELAAIEGVEDLAMTTNASKLVATAVPLREAGLERLTVSLDSLDPANFRRITQRADLQPVLDGLEAAVAAGFSNIKLNAVIKRGVNDHEILDLVAFAREHGFEMRFIEYMDVGNANAWSSDKLAPKGEMLETVAARHPLRPVGNRGSRPAEDYEFVDGGGRVGFIASVTEPFCGTCSRIRLTADGRIVTCLFSHLGHDIKSMLRGEETDAEIADFIRHVWERRTDRYSEQRLAALGSQEGYSPSQRKKIEMISLGG